MKRKLISLLVFSLVALIAGGSMAMASSGKLTEIEQKWFDFRKAVAERQVKDGILTRQQADSMIAELQKRLETEGDTVYEKFAKKFSLDGSGKREKGKEGAIMRLYAQVTDRTPEQINSLCDKDKIGIWDLAKKEGHTDQLKSALLTMATNNLDRKVGEGILTKQQRDEALKKIADTLNGPNPNLAEFGFHKHSGF
jgi:hypothetical protein